MATKQPVDTIKADLRVLSELADENVNQVSWLTPAFWTMATTAVTNLIAVAAVIGWVRASDVEGLTQMVTALVAAVQVIVVNSVLVWKYIAGQNALQVQKLNAQYKYMEAVTVEKMRAKLFEGKA